MSAVALPLDLKRLEDLLLEGVGAQLEAEAGGGRSRPVVPGEGLVELVGIPLGLVGLELAVLPVALEGAAELVEL